MLNVTLLVPALKLPLLLKSRVIVKSPDPAVAVNVTPALIVRKLKVSDPVFVIVELPVKFALLLVIKVRFPLFVNSVPKFKISFASVVKVPPEYLNPSLKFLILYCPVLVIEPDVSVTSPLKFKVCALLVAGVDNMVPPVKFTAAKFKRA